jgi:hypothetical protein
MSHEQIKGTFFAVGATAASTALLVGGIATYNHAQSTAAADEQAVIFNEAHSTNGATDALTGATGEFSDHCTVMREGMQFTVGPMSFSTSNTSLRGTPVPPSRSTTGFDWQWVNKDRVSPTGVRTDVPDVVGTTPENVSTPEGRTQENLNAWYQQIWDSDFRVGRVEIGYHPGGQPNPAIPQVLAAHCEWDVKVSSNADTNSEGSTLNDDVTLDAVPVWDLAEGETAPWLTVDGEKAQVTVHGRAYHTAYKPVKGSPTPADAQLIGETDLNFNEPGTKTATINKPSNLDGGYVTWVWSVEKNNQPETWGKYLINNTVSDGWAAENEVVELPKAPKPAPSVAAPTIEPSEAPTPSATKPTPTPTPSDTTPTSEPTPSATPSTPVSKTTPSVTPTPGENETPAPTPSDPTGSTPSAPGTPNTVTPQTSHETSHTSLAHTGSPALPLIELGVISLAGGLTLALRKRNVG